MDSPSSSSPPSYTQDVQPYMYAAARWACFRPAQAQRRRRNGCQSTTITTPLCRHPPQLAVVLLLLALASTTTTSAAVVDMDPPPGKTCFGPADLFEIGKAEIFVILNLAPGGVTLSDTRRYELCTDTTYPFGLEDANSGPFFTYDGNTETRLRPMSLVNPNLEIHCGPPPGSSANGCTFGGPNSGVAVNTPADRQTIVDFVNLLGPTINPAYANIGNAIPPTWRPDTTNLVLRGITFRGSEAVEDDGCSSTPATHPSCLYGPVRLYAYGQNQRIVDCRFEYSGRARPQYGGIVLSYNQAWHEVDPNRDMTLPYQELTVEDTVFENNQFQQGAIVTRMANATNAGDPPDGTARKGFQIHIVNSKFQSNTIRGPHVLTLWEATGRVETSCFVDNVVDQTVVSDVFGPAATAAAAAAQEGGFDFRAPSPSNACGACTQGVYSAGGFQGKVDDYCPDLCECNVDISSTKRRTIKSKPVVLQDESTEQCLRVQGRNGLGLGACSAKNSFFATKRGQLKRKGKRPFCITAYLKNGDTPAVKLSRCKNKRKKSSNQQLWKHSPNGIIQMRKAFKGVKYCLSTTGGDGHTHDDHGGDGDGHAHDDDDSKLLTLVACSSVGAVVPWKAGLPITAVPSN